MDELDQLTLTELIQLQTRLGETLRRRFEKQLCLAFSDIAGSTEYFARHGDAAGKGLQQRHLDLLAQALRQHGGRLVDTAGDGAFVVFPSVDAGAAAFIGLQRALSTQNEGYPREHQLLLRVGVHFGPALTDGALVSGDAVNFAARVCGAAAPGEVRLSRAAFRELGKDLRLRCRGLPPVALKGIADLQELVALDCFDRSLLPAKVRVLETGEEFALPAQDTIAFGRLAERNGIVANDIVLTLPDAEKARQVSRWHFELRRRAGGFLLRSVTDQSTVVDGVTLAKGDERPVLPGATVRLGKVLTLELLAEAAPADDAGTATHFED